MVLLLLNLAAFGWMQWKPLPVLEKPRATDPAIPPLVLLDERTPAQLRQAGDQVARDLGPAVTPDRLLQDDVAETSGRAPVANSMCAKIGPFEKQSDASAWLSGLTVALSKSSVESAQDMVTSGFWVYLAQATDREAALVLSRRLSAAGVRDFYVVTSGENENSISLGVFRDAINADRRVAQVQALGFYPKRLERGEPKVRYFAFTEFSGDSQRAIRSSLAGTQRFDRVDCRRNG